MNNEQKIALKGVLGGIGVMAIIIGAMTNLYDTSVGVVIALAIWIVGIPLLSVFGLGPQKKAEADVDKSRSSFPAVLIVIFAVAAIVVLLVATTIIVALTTDTFFLRGSGDLTTEKRDVSDFDRITLKGQGTIIIDQTGEESLKVTAEDNLIDSIEAKVEGNTLKIGVKKEWFLWALFWPTKKIEYHISVDELEQITISGSGNIETGGLKANDLKIQISGSGKGDMAIEVKSLDINISGSGKLVFSGKARNQEINISGSGNVDGEKLKSEDAAFTINGSGKGIVNASDTLDVNINGSGDIKYLGSPSIDKQISGSGKVSKFNE